MRIGKVYYNLYESEYHYKYKRFLFVFSSKLYINNFINQLEKYVDLESKKLIAKYNVELESSEYLALSLYKKIEKRGFLVYYNDEEIDKNKSFSISISALKYL